MAFAKVLFNVIFSIDYLFLISFHQHQLSSIWHIIMVASEQQPAKLNNIKI